MVAYLLRHFRNLLYIYLTLLSLLNLNVLGCAQN